MGASTELALFDHRVLNHRFLSGNDTRVISGRSVLRLSESVEKPL